MISSKNGIDTLEVEVLNISPHGIWLYVKGKEYFLSYQDYPWFKESKVTDIFEVELLHDTHLHWPQLDIDLEIESLDNPEKFPLKYQE
ncbi:DUF2442 domain-containing protein [candidate division KSB1 bacterium]|nr:DUF2442 domain-containing protein [candidate division KSB1 bacterium]